MDHARFCRGGGLQGCSRDEHRNDWRCARAVRQRPLENASQLHVFLAPGIPSTPLTCLPHPLHVFHTRYMSSTPVACLPHPLHVFHTRCMSSTPVACLPHPLHVFHTRCMSSTPVPCILPPSHSFCGLHIPCLPTSGSGEHGPGSVHASPCEDLQWDQPDTWASPVNTLRAGHPSRSRVGNHRSARCAATVPAPMPHESEKTTAVQ